MAQRQVSQIMVPVDSSWRVTRCMLRTRLPFWFASSWRVCWAFECALIVRIAAKVAIHAKTASAAMQNHKAE